MANEIDLSDLNSVSGGAYVGPCSVYVVKPGDTLALIAAQHGTTVPALIAANQLYSDSVRVGQRLLIPG